MGNGTYLDVVGVGTYKLDLGDSIMVLKDVSFVPRIRRNLIYVPALTRNGLEVRFYNDIFLIEKDNEVFAMGKYEPEHGLFQLSTVTKIENNDIGNSDSVLSYNTCMYDMWHQRLGHPEINKMKRIIRDNLLPSMDINKSLCEYCIKGKMTRNPFNEFLNKTFEKK